VDRIGLRLTQRAPVQPVTVRATPLIPQRGLIQGQIQSPTQSQIQSRTRNRV
jgi:hypothetical protein